MCGSEYDSAPTTVQQGDTEQLPGQVLEQAWAAHEVLAGAWRPAQCFALIISFNCHSTSFHRQEPAEFVFD